MNVAGNLSLGVPKWRSTPRQTWEHQAACRGSNPDLWFLDDNTGSYREARQVCAACPVRTECLAWALETNTEHGLWGGLNPIERRRLRRRQRAS